MTTTSPVARAAVALLLMWIPCACASAQQLLAPATIVRATASSICSPQNRLVTVRAAQSPVDLSLPAALSAGQIMTVNIEVASFAVTVRASGADTIVDPSGAGFMGGGCAAGEMATFVSNGAGTWYVQNAINNGCANWAAHAPASAAARVPRGSAVGQILSWNGTAWIAQPQEELVGVLSGSTNSVKPARAIWTCLVGEGSTYASEALYNTNPVTRNVTLKNFVAQVAPAPGAGEWVTLRIKRVTAGGNPPGTALAPVITIAGTSVSGSDTFDLADCNAGDLLYLEITGSTNCAAKNAAWGVEEAAR